MTHETMPGKMWLFSSIFLRAETLESIASFVRGLMWPNVADHKERHLGT